VLQGLELVVHDAKSLRVQARDDTLIAAYLIEPGRASYELDDLAAEYGIEVTPSPPADEETTALVRRAALPPRLIETMRGRIRERGSEQLYETIELPLTEVLGAMEAAGVKIDTYRMGEITARLAERVEELEEKAYEIAGAEVMLGWQQHVARRRTAGCTRPSPTPALRLAGSRPRTRTCRRSRSAPSSGARSAPPSSPRRGAGSCQRTTPRSSCASSPTSPASRSCARRSRSA